MDQETVEHDRQHGAYPRLFAVYAKADAGSRNVGLARSDGASAFNRGESPDQAAELADYWAQVGLDTFPACRHHLANPVEGAFWEGYFLAKSEVGSSDCPLYEGGARI